MVTAHCCIAHMSRWSGVRLLYVCGQYGDCLWEEAVSESFSLGFNGPAPLAGGQYFKQRGGRMGAVSDDAGLSAEAAWQVDVLQGGERTADDLLHRLDHPLEPQALCFSAEVEPHCDAVGRDALDSWAVESYQQPLVYVVLHKVLSGSTGAALLYWW